MRLSVTLVYATGGSEDWMEAMEVDMASSVVTHRFTRAGAWETVEEDDIR